MAELSRDDEELVLTLTTAEKAESLHGDIRVPFSSVQEVEVVEDIIHAVHGLKLPGSRWPGRFAIGTFVHDDTKTFAVVHHDTARGVRVRLADGAFSELLVGCANPEAIAASIAKGS
ncbi:PH domain-containing protein [Ferrimicrobium acidiphilum]|jgi:hypothetical protein|uniref:PH domain-containing protein n=1 Tax=Ferrimicrobium acidiphilum TaxID=121039 RepID=UPI0023F3BEAA|nr:PH domain-containing protein [Ferrimicrobium acidiphilum]